ncbi:plasmid maintenance system killer [Desulfonatronospira thiodismutans ASO3-1]|uniref:Plasmid maintenance system killer n=1 Tax=Desulfonatronospira thiodismutans ASO3-1 TaxID=555779 RepID=D6SJR4_9BACT|nr:type II toxin-antitoxin system RelE/ParE family toxin [Desulfonatronospira thiodismutans]EFI36117.1 plasmid maintenance system killer [Desulfonatronospira thiodismutans ASO3-1]
MNIVSFKHKGLKKLYENDDPSGLPNQHVVKIKNILAALEFAGDLSQVASVPGWKLHPLKGDRKGEYAITVTGNMRITFYLKGNNIHLINFEDYH